MIKISYYNHSIVISS